MYHLVGIDKVAEQHILVKCCKYSHFGVISNLRNVGTNTITHLDVDLDLQ